MKNKMKEHKIPFPKFEPGELMDIIEFLLAEKGKQVPEGDSAESHERRGDSH